MSETPEERARRELAEGAPPSLVAGYLCCEIHQDLDDPGTCEDCIDFISRLAANDALERAAQKAEQHITDVPHYPGQVVAPSERVSNETAAEIAAAIRGLKDARRRSCSRVLHTHAEMELHKLAAAIREGEEK